MKKWLVTLCLVIAAVLTVAACSGSNDSGNTGQNDQQQAATGETKSFTIKATNFAFEPQEMKVNQGDTVEITLENAEGMHAITIEGYDVEIQADSPVRFVADEAGEFTFSCSIFCGTGHADMTGTLVVQ